MRCLLCVANYVFSSNLYLYEFILIAFKNVISTFLDVFCNLKNWQKSDLETWFWTICINSGVVQFAPHWFQQFLNVFSVFLMCLSEFQAKYAAGMQWLAITTCKAFSEGLTILGKIFFFHKYVNNVFLQMLLSWWQQLRQHVQLFNSLTVQYLVCLLVFSALFTCGYLQVVFAIESHVESLRAFIYTWHENVSQTRSYNPLRLEFTSLTTYANANMRNFCFKVYTKQKQNSFGQSKFPTMCESVVLLISFLISLNDWKMRAQSLLFFRLNA